MNLTSAQLRRASAIWLCLIPLGCQEKNELIRKHQSQQSFGATSAPRDSDDGKGEEVVPPVNITGTYLQCTAANVPFDAPDASAMGCAVYDVNTQSRVKLSTLVKDIGWGYDPASVESKTEIAIYKIGDESSPLPYDVYYSFRNTSKSIQDVLAQFVITMDVTPLSGERQLYRNSVFMSQPPSGNPAPQAEEVPANILGGA